MYAYRYEECWLPLLASCPDGFTPMAESFGQPLPLRPPLDCEWVWLCHRLNPVKASFDFALLPTPHSFRVLVLRFVVF